MIPARTRSRPGPGNRGGPAFTLIEVVLTVAVVSIIMGAMVSVMLLATRGMNCGLVRDENTTEGTRAVQQITLDLSLAQAFTERTDRTVAFTVPDRDGDGQPESIRYAWSGVAGDPLTREYNGGPAVNVAENMHHFKLDYLLKTSGSSAALILPRGEAITMISRDNAPSVPPGLGGGPTPAEEPVLCP